MRFHIYWLAILFIFLPQVVYAKYDPLSVPNNKYGIHIADTNDLSEAAKLVNSSGGDWGYVTLVIPSNDRNSGKWQGVFDSMRRLHIIPIVRLAGRSVDDFWTVPEGRDIDDWVSFLTSLNWPVENRYVILYNEPNHSKEWGNQVNPEEYADIFVSMARKLKDASDDFYILPAALDVSANDKYESMDAEQFLRRMIRAKPEIVDLMDGLNSHSYPNPSFSGSPSAYGRGTIRSYQWERQIFKELGLTRNVPVFITETGWQHRDGKMKDSSLLSPEIVSGYILQSSTGAWNDPSIAAITPFVFNYQDYPFDHFSWKMLGDSGYYPMYTAFSEIVKTRGMPVQHQKYSFIHRLIPDSLIANSTYTLAAEIKNEGQNIVDRDDGYTLRIVSDGPFEFNPSPLPHLEPGSKGFIALGIKTPDKPGAYKISVTVGHDDRRVTVEQKDIIIVPPPLLSLSVKLGWQSVSNTDHARVLIYDLNDRIVHEFRDNAVVNNSISITDLTNVVPGDTYRVVVIIPYYLPRQQYVVISPDQTNLVLPRFLPFDLNNDGTMNLKDITALIYTKPAFVFNLLFGP